LIPGVACFYGLSHLTAPSFAPRITAVGKLYNHVERRYGRDSYYGYRFVPDGGNPVNIETDIILPNWDSPAIFNGRTFRVVYLDSNERSLKNEAIDIAILSGKDAGFHDFVDARPSEDWLGIPVGAALFAFGFLGLRYMEDDSNSEASDDDDLPSV
jgi:hypothetical protein